MPKRSDIDTILVIGAGPIVIGPGCEFDYSGTQAIKALKEEGYRVVLINSNPATIMTDPQFSDKTYIEPISAEYIEAIIKKEKPDAILPTVGGQTALNVAMKLDEEGILKKYNVELIGANRKAIETAESREMFKSAMQEIGLDLPYGYTVKSLDEAKNLLGKISECCFSQPAAKTAKQIVVTVVRKDLWRNRANDNLDFFKLKKFSLRQFWLQWFFWSTCTFQKTYTA